MPDEQQQPAEDNGKKQKPKPAEQAPAPKPDDGKVAKQVIESLNALKNRISDLEKKVTGVDQALALFGKNQSGELRDIKTTVGAQDDRVVELAKAFDMFKSDLKKELEAVLKQAGSQPALLEASAKRVEKTCQEQARANRALFTSFRRPVLSTGALVAFGIVFALAIVEGLALWRVYG